LRQWRANQRELHCYRQAACDARLVVRLPRKDAEFVALEAIEEGKGCCGVGVV